MKLTYRGLGLHTLGHVMIADEGFEHAGQELPTRQRHWIKVRIQTPDETHGWEQHRGIIGQITTALATVNGPLRWESDQGLVVLDQEVEVTQAPARSMDIDPLGNSTQAVDMTFAWYEPITASRLTTTFTPAGTPALPAVDLGEVTDFAANYDVTRASEYADPAERVGGQVTMTGIIHAPDPSAAIADRRTALLARMAELEVALLDRRRGLLSHGAGDQSFFNRTVRIASFRPRINQAAERIEWSLAGTYTRFPDEAAFTIASYSLKTASNREAGEVLQTLSGSMLATDQSTADAAVDALVSGVSGGSTALTDERTPETVVSPDGPVFVRLGFTVTFRKRSGFLLEAKLRIEDGEELSAGQIQRTYSGRVVYQASTWASAWSQAVAKARALGDGKHPFRMRGRWTVSDNQQTFDRVTTGGFVVAVEFVFEYRVTGNRIHVALSTDTTRDRFGQYGLAVSGTIQATSSATATSIYNLLRDTLSTGGRRRGERFGERSERVPTVAGIPVGVSTTPVPAISGGPLANGGETADPVLSGYTAQFLRFEFSFTVFQLRAAGQDVAVAWKQRIEVDYLSLAKRSSLQGEVYAANLNDAAWALEQVTSGLALGTLIRSGTEEGYERFLGATVGGTPEAKYLTAWGFSLEYADRVTGDSALVESSVSETMKHSGLLPVVIPVASGRPKLQAKSYGEARRTLRARCAGGNELACRTWLHGCLSLATYVALPVGVVAVEAAPEITLNYTSVPRTTLVPRGDGGNAQLVVAELSKETVYDQWDYAAPAAP